LPSLRVALLDSTATATLVTPCLTPLAGFAAPGITLQASFAADGSNGATPEATLTAAGNGLFYGTTTSGGANGDGAIFSFDSTTGSITLIDSFTGSNGNAPFAALTPAGNGLYYGTTVIGGASGKGAIFSFDSATGSITLQDSFIGSNGDSPFFGALTPAENGLYYGTTVVGGANNLGAIFAFDLASGSITLQGSFNGSNGANPYSALTAAGNGLFYGTTAGGGTNNIGAIFSFDSSTGTITLQDSFINSNGVILLPH
jgi:uncharacterized repeat protein (TIGR03803 family)